MSSELETATFGAGCFWGVEEAYRQIEGVVETAAGYAGGTTENPTYKDVCGGGTGHAEVVQVTYDPSRVSFGKLLDVFWSIHDPTQLNRQGPDVGEQYRSIILCRTPQQQATAAASLRAVEESGRFPRRIVTEIQTAGSFYRAEEDHQCYLAKRGRSSCASTLRK
ncbi:MAG: peptide-methionine (S)-S-oxide reductase MsrA [Planctomycetota bacterium]|jgi:peptide-methionine (S)-S-oxide reductase